MDWGWVLSSLECLCSSSWGWLLMARKTLAASSPLHPRISKTVLTLERGPGWHSTSSRSSRVNTSRLTKTSSSESIFPSNSSTRETRRTLIVVKQELQASVSTITHLKQCPVRIRNVQLQSAANVKQDHVVKWFPSIALRQLRRSELFVVNTERGSAYPSTQTETSIVML